MTRFARWCGILIIGILERVWPNTWREKMTDPFSEADWDELAQRITHLCARINSDDLPTRQDVDDLAIANALMRRLWEQILPFANETQRELAQQYMTDAALWQAIVESSFESAHEECEGA